MVTDQGDQLTKRNHGNPAKRKSDPVLCESTGEGKLLIPDNDTADLGQTFGETSVKKTKFKKKTKVDAPRTHAMATRSRKNKDA